jgi:formylglycine-generating enzyme required for sulfatase activity
MVFPISKKQIGPLILLFVFCLYSPMHAQEFEGIVQKGLQREGVEGLTVRLTPPSHSNLSEKITLTDQDGRFSLRNVSDSQYLLQVLNGSDLVYRKVISYPEEQRVKVELGRFLNSVGMGFLFVEPGDFIMGSPPNEPGHQDNEKQRKVNIEKGFFIQTTEVTQKQWSQIMSDNPSVNEDGPCLGDASNCPVQNVSIESIQSFIMQLNEIEGTSAYRLPNEKEWEYACRAGTQTPFNTGMCLTEEIAGQGVKKLANFNAAAPFPDCPKANYADQLLPIAQFSQNPWGLFDMHGNVAEFCFSSENDLNSFSDKLILRGGAYNSSPGACRSASRYWPMESQEILVLNGNKHVGFRLVYDLKN